MQRLQQSLIRIIKGPTGGFLASLGIAAVLGGVALASPSPPVASVPDHHPDVITADPLGSYPTSNGTVASSAPTPSGGVQTTADPVGRGPALDPGGRDHSPHNGRGRGSANTSGGGLRSAGATPAHQDARDDPPRAGAHPPHNHGSTGHHGSGPHQPGQGSGGSGSGSGQSSSGHQDNPGSGGSSSGPGSADRGTGGSPPPAGGTTGSSGSGGSGGGAAGGGNSTNGHARR